MATFAFTKIKKPWGVFLVELQHDFHVQYREEAGGVIVIEGRPDLPTSFTHNGQKVESHTIEARAKTFEEAVENFQAAFDKEYGSVPAPAFGS